MTRLAVFCGSRAGDAPVFRERAFALGAALGARGVELVYGGARHGLMGALADGALSRQGRVVGVVPRGLAREEFAHQQLSVHHQVATMAERKALMIDLSDAFVALPGGFGTMDELFEVLTLAQLELHHKPIGLLEVDGFFEPLTRWISGALQRGFIPGGLKDLLVVDSHPEALVETLLSRCPASAQAR